MRTVIRNCIPKSIRVYIWKTILLFERCKDVMAKGLYDARGRYFCPVCERKVVRWLPFRRYVDVKESIVENKDRLCPHCGSFERTRHFILWIKQNDILNNTRRFLHFAPERGLSEYLRTALGAGYVTADIAMPDVDYSEDITSLSFADNSFDYIYCSNVLEHVERDIDAMRELYRVLSKNGRLLVQVPIRGESTYEDYSVKTPAERTRLFGQADHVRYYGRDIKQRLEGVGFKVNDVYMLDLLRLSERAITRMNLSARELVHFCTKL